MQPAAPEIKTGKWLATAYCGSCHLVPKADALPRSLWENTILPRMGNRLGIYTTKHSRAAALALDPAGNQGGENESRYPPNASLSVEEWAKIESYYLDAAPSALAVDTLKFGGQVNWLKPRFPEIFMSPPAGTFIDFLPTGGLLYGDANKKSLFLFDQQLEPLRSFEVGEGVTAFATGKQGKSYLSVIGSFSPTDALVGSVWSIDAYGKAIPEIEQLYRTTEVAVFDVNADGRDELLISEFGKENGRLAFWTKANGTWQANELYHGPGTTRAIPVDLNQDEEVDILALMAQGNERIMGYYQDQGGWEARTLLRFPPSYGSSSMDTIDFNKDGLIDILYTAGDNADYAPVLKPYHGIYLYLQQTDGTFEQALFLPLNGAYAVKAADFDLDGDLDLAAISFFPDFLRQPAQGIVLYEQQGPGVFQPLRLPAVPLGRWIRLSVGDLDNDGDIDLAASSLAFETVPDNGQVKKWVEQGLPFVVWENTTR